MQTTRTRRGSSFQERDSEGRFTNRRRGNEYGYENDYDDDRFGSRNSRYDQGDFEEGGYGRSSRYQGDETYLDEDYPGNRGRRAYYNSAEYDDEDYDYDVDRYDENDDYGTRGRYDRDERWGRRDFSSLNRGEYRNQPRGMHNSGWNDSHYGNVSSRRGYNVRGGFGGRYEGEAYREGGGYRPEMYEGGLSSRRSSGRGQGFASMPREEVRRIASMGGRTSSRRRPFRSQRSTRSRSTR